MQRLSLLKTGNLVLVDDENSIKWQSFNFPTDIMVWGQRLSSKTRLTSFPLNSTLFYSMEIKDEKIELFLNYGKSKYSYWGYKPLGERNITFVELTSSGLEIFNGDHKFDEVGSKATSSEPLRFLSLDNTTGNLRTYHYSQERGKFEASYQALNSTCDLPLSCEPYGVCTPSGSCSCIRLVSDQKACNEANDLEGKCGAMQTEMVELRGVLSVLESDSYKAGVGKEECSSLCNDDCGCVAAQYVEEEEDVRSSGRCFLYEIARGIKTVEVGERGTYMVKVVRGVNHGSGKSFGLKKWVIIVVVVVDVFVILVVLGGVGYYIFWKRRKNLAVRGQGS